MNTAFGIIQPSRRDFYIDGMGDFRTIGAFSFMGRYRIVDFPISNMTNSAIEQIQVYIKRKPMTMVQHLGSGRHYNINSKRGKLHLLFSQSTSEHDIYNTDIASYVDNMETILSMNQQYVILAPSYMIYRADYSELLNQHVESGADVTLLYHSVDNAKEAFLNCHTVTLNKQKGLLSIDKNHGTAKNRNILMDTYIMKKDLFIDLVKQAKKTSSLYTLTDILNDSCNDLDIRGVSHRGFFACINNLKSYYDASLSLINSDLVSDLFKEDWPIYTKTNDSCPTHYLETAKVTSSVISNGCQIEGTVINSVIGRDCIIKKDTVVKDSIVLAGTVIEEGVHVEKYIIDTRSRLTHIKDLKAPIGTIGYVRKGDIL